MRAASAPIPLTRPDLTRADADAVSDAIRRLTDQTAAPVSWPVSWTDPAAVIAWETTIAALWDRPALVFADADGLFTALYRVHGWRAGDVLLTDGWLEPSWREACAALWLLVHPVDIDSRSALGVPDPEAIRTSSVPQAPRAPRAWIRRHAFGLPAQPPVGPSSSGIMQIEECSALPVPHTGCGWGDVQIISGTDNHPISAGSSAVLLSRDADLIRALGTVRERLPGSVACALGHSQWLRWPHTEIWRSWLAQAYLDQLHTHGVLELPTCPATGRGWERFVVHTNTTAQRDALQQFLERSRIHSGSPLWHTLPGIGQLPGLAAWHGQALALPLFAGLAATDQKRVINRMHRYLERQRSEPR